MQPPAHLRKGSVFRTYLLSYLVILMIPVLMSVLVFGKARAVLTEEATRANDLLLKQMQSNLDMVLGDVGRLSLMVTNNDRLAGLMHEAPPVEGRDYYLAYLATKDFHVYRVASDGALDFYVYLPGLDMVVSPDGYFTSRSFHKTRMSRLGYTYEEWLGRLRQVTRQSYFASRVETETNAIVDTIAVVAPLPAAKTTGISRGWLVVHIDSAVFRDAFRSTAWTDKSLLVLYHRGQGVVAGSETDVPAEVLAPGGQGEIRIGRESYVCLRRDSDVAGLQYISLIPTNIYASRFVMLSRYTFVAFLVCLVVGIVVIYWFAVARYRPVRGLLRILGLEAPRAKSGSDEFAQIGASISQTLEQDRHLREEASRSKPLLAQRALRQLLTGQVPEDEAATQELERLGGSLPSPYLVLALVEADEGQEELEARQSALRVLLERGLARGAQIVSDLDGATGMLFGSPDARIELVRELVAHGKAEAEREYPARIAAGLSDAHRREDGLRVLYDEARAALGFWLVKGGDQPIAYRDVSSSSRSYDYPIEEETKLINSIRAGDSALAGRILDGIYARNLGGAPLSLEMARCLMFDLTSTMVKTVDTIMTQDNDAAFWSRMRPASRLSSCRSFDRLRSEMDGILEAVCDHVTRSRTSHNEKLRQEILAFVHANFRDKSLCPDTVALHLGRNTAYLSRFFREHMDMGISSYLKRYRVTRARELLSHGELGIGEIAEQVGFSESNALIRAFKEVEGVTPGQFRTSCLGRTGGA